MHLGMTDIGLVCRVRQYELRKHDRALKTNVRDQPNSTTEACSNSNGWKEDAGGDLNKSMSFFMTRRCAGCAYHHTKCPRGEPNFDHSCENKEENIRPDGGGTIYRVSVASHPRKICIYPLAEAMVIRLRGIALLEQVGDKL